MPRGRRGGFTLIEIILVVAMLTLLMGVLSVTMFGRVEDGYLDEGASRVATALRMVRAEAALKGRHFRLSFDAEQDLIVVEWEPQPLAQPGQFIAYGGPMWLASLPNEMVRVVRCRLVGHSAVSLTQYGPSAGGSSGMGESEAIDRRPITFYPDGSGDSAIIELASRSAADHRSAVIEIDGINNQIHVHVLAPSELAAFYEVREIEVTGSLHGY